MKYVALLRGVNAGGRTIRMIELRVCFENMGFENVKTLLASGNVIFETDESDEAKLKQKVENGLCDRFNYAAKAQVYDAEVLKNAIEKYPFGKAGSSQHDYVLFLENGLEKDLIKESYQLAPNEKVQAGQGIVYWRAEKGQTLKSDFAKQLGKAKYRSLSTNRNMNTVRKIYELMKV